MSQNVYWRDDPVDIGFFGPERRALATVQPDLAAEVFWDGDALGTTAEGWDEGEPLRQWTAYGADGEVLERFTGRTWVPPEHATRVRVTVGMALDRWVHL